MPPKKRSSASKIEKIISDTPYRKRADAKLEGKTISELKEILKDKGYTISQVPKSAAAPKKGELIAFLIDEGAIKSKKDKIKISKSPKKHKKSKPNEFTRDIFLIGNPEKSDF